MTLALFALLALVAVLLLGAMRTDLNVGLLALAVTFALGTWGAHLDTARLAALFPSSLVLTVIGVALFFTLAEQNGTLGRLTALVLRFAGRRAGTLPLTFFALALALSALGPGNIASVALLAPIAMPAAVAAGVSPLLMAIAVCTGANAGTFSPVAVTGSLNTALMHGIGLTGAGQPLRVFASVAVLQALSAALAYLLFGRRPGRAVSQSHPDHPAAQPFKRRHRLTLLGCLVFIALVVALRVNAATAAFALAALLTLARAGGAEAAIRALPWGVVLMVGGVGSLVNLLEETGSLDLGSGLLARFATPHTVHATLAFVAGLLSVGSSSSGVVMPLFVPLVPDLLARAGAGGALSAVIAIDMGSHLVDVSPLSTLGALCLAALPPEVERGRVFRALLAWGLAMAVLGAALAWLFLDVL